MNDGSALWHSLGCPKHKLVVGMAFYGRSFTLGSPENNGLRAPVKQWDTNGGLPGKYTNESSFLSYFEICMGLAEGNWTERYDSVGECPYAFKGNQWVGYENAHSLRVKADWLRNNSYGGAMVWALDLDDYRGSCGEKNVLFNALANGLIGYEVFVPSKAQQTTTQTPNPWWPQSLTSSSTTTTTADTAVDLTLNSPSRRLPGRRQARRERRQPRGGRRRPRPPRARNHQLPSQRQQQANLATTPMKTATTLAASRNQAAAAAASVRRRRLASRSPRSGRIRASRASTCGA